MGGTDTRTDGERDQETKQLERATEDDVHMLDHLVRLVLFLDAPCLDSFGIQHALHLCKLPRLLRLPHDGQTDDMRVRCVESDSRRV